MKLYLNKKNREVTIIPQNDFGKEERVELYEDDNTLFETDILNQNITIEWGLPDGSGYIQTDKITKKISEDSEGNISEDKYLYFIWKNEVTCIDGMGYMNIVIKDKAGKKRQSTFTAPYRVVKSAIDENSFTSSERTDLMNKLENKINDGNNTYKKLLQAIEAGDLDIIKDDVAEHSRNIAENSRNISDHSTNLDYINKTWYPTMNDTTGKHYTDVSNKDIRGITKSGRYRGKNVINAKNNDLHTFIVDYIDSNNINILSFNIAAKSVHYMVKNSSGWSGWINILNDTSNINPSKVTQDNTHKFVTNTEKDTWNKNTRTFLKTFTDLTQVTLTCNSSIYTNFLEVDIIINNKENISDFSFCVNGSTVFTETGGGTIALHVKIYRINSNSWMYYKSGVIEHTSAGYYNISGVGHINSTADITSVGLKTNGTDKMNGCSSIIRKY